MEGKISLFGNQLDKNKTLRLLEEYSLSQLD